MPLQDKITSYEALERLIGEGYVLTGPRPAMEKNLRAVKGIFKRGLEVIPETWFVANGYGFVEPSKFTKGFKLAYKADGTEVEQYFKSKYSLTKDDTETPLYLLHETPL